MPKISVIVPIYNAAVYLEKCLSSLQTQSFKDIEILCIDDGSTDNTYALLKRFSTKDKRLKIFTQKHQGPGVARNVGIQKSTGNYLCFVDADDICHKDMLKTAYEQAVKTNADIVCFDSFHYTGNMANTPRLGEEKLPSVLPTPLSAQTENILAAVPVHAFAKLFKKDLITQNKLSFSDGFFYATDLGLTLPALALARTIIHLDECLYYYRVGNKKSLSWDNKTYPQMFTAFEVLKTQFETHPNAVNMRYFFEKAQLRLTLNCLKRFMLISNIRPFYNLYQKYLHNLIHHSELNLSRLRNDHAIEVGEKFKGFPYNYARYFRPDLFHGDPLRPSTFQKSALFIRYLPRILTDIHRQAVQILDFMKKNPLLQEFPKPTTLTHNIPLVFSVGETDAPILMITLKSLLEHIDTFHHYDIVILHENLLNRYQTSFKELIRNNKNVQIRFYNVSYFFNRYPFVQDYARRTNQRSTFYKFFIPEIFQYYSKVICLDTDILIKTNIANLYKTRIKKYLIAAALDTPLQALLNAMDLKLKQNTFNRLLQLNLFNPHHYFNTGVLVMNIRRMDEYKIMDLQKKILTMFKELNLSATDLFNLVFENQTYYLNTRWNVQTAFNSHPQIKYFPQYLKKTFQADLKHPFILHFNADQKPWSNPLQPLTQEFIRYLPKIPQAVLNLLGHVPGPLTILKQKPNPKAIPIVYLLDYQSILSTQVSLFSLLMYKRPETRYHIYIIGVNLMPEIQAEFKKLVSDAVDITFLNQPPFQTQLTITPQTILKFDLPTLLKPLDKVIYLNSSLLAQDDLTDLYQTPLKKTYAAVVKDLEKMKNLTHHKLNLKSYFNDDMMVLNLKKMRQDEITLKLKLRRTYEAKINGSDQSAFNFIFNQNITYLPQAANLKPAITSAFLNALLPIYQHTPEDIYRHADPILINLTQVDNPMAIYNHPLFQQYLQKMNQLYPTFNSFQQLVRQQQIQNITALRHEIKNLTNLTTSLKQNKKTPSISAPVKILFDASIFTLPQKTGLYRVGLNLLKGLSRDTRLDVSLLISTPTFNPTSFLIENNLEYLAGKLVLMPSLFEQAVNPNHITQTLSAEQITCLKSYRIFFSTFFPIADIVYKSGLKTVSFVHDIFAVRIPNLLYTIPQAQKHHKKWIDELHADFLIFNSVFSQTDFLNYRTDYPKEKTVVSYLGADSHFTHRQEAEILAVKKTYHITTPKYFLTLSDNMPRKNIEHLIRAFIQFLKKTKAKDISLVLAGPHYLNNTKLADFKKTLKLYRSQIIFTGFIKEEDLPALYSGALAFVFPSLYEGFGLPVLEALCCKTAVICSNNTSLPEVAGKAALYISGQKISETTSALETLYQKPAVRKRLLAKAEEQSAQFSWKKTSKIIADTFLKLK